MSWGILGTDGRGRTDTTRPARLSLRRRPRPSSAAGGGQANGRDVTEVVLDGRGRESTLNLTDTRDSLLTMES